MVRGERERSRLIPELNRFPAANPSRTASIIFQESKLTKESVQIAAPNLILADLTPFW
ncbi:MAG: hypothetical protein RLZ45_263, partial [Verrucomicrobiota bacterium]